MLLLKDIVKNYQTGTETVNALKGVSISFRKSEFVSILGQSGCGKTTLLNIVGGLDRYTSGDLVINGRSTKDYLDKDWDTYRNHSIGFVFQSYNLITHQTVLANVELALTLSGVSKEERRQRAIKALERVGLGNQLKKKPTQMSGGQMQRVAIARALVNDPDILLADEPTGALDSNTSVQIMEILKEISKEKLVIMVTHNGDLAEEYSTRIIRLHDGMVTSDTNPYSEAELKADEAKEEKHETVKKSKRQMSLFTALSLSFNNLMTKKGRTILTAFAGSIGIIGIALILSLSNGIQTFIDQVQEETLSSYPVYIQEETTDLSSMLNNFMQIQIANGEHDLDKVYSNSTVLELFNSLNKLGEVKNNLKDFKKFLIENKTVHAEYISAIQYSYNLDLQIVNINKDGDVTKANPSELMQLIMGAMFGSSMNDVATDMMPFGEAMMGGGIQNNFCEIVPANDGAVINEMIYNQYDLIYGDWPKAYDEMILIVNQNNEISDLALYSLGIKDQDEFKQLFEAWQNGEEMKSELSSYTYKEITELTYKLVLPTDYYADDNKDGIWEDKSEDTTHLRWLYSSKATPLKITGIIRPAEGVSSTALTGSIGYTYKLTEWYINQINNSDIVKQQKESTNKNVIGGLYFPTPDNIPQTKDEKLVKINEHLASLNIIEKVKLCKQILTTADDDYLEKAYYNHMATDNPDEEMMKQTLISYAVKFGTPEDKAKEMVNGLAQNGQLEKTYKEFFITMEKTNYTMQKNKELMGKTNDEVIAMVDDLLANADETKVKFIYETFIPTGLSELTYEEVLELLGVVDLDDPSAISIYAKDFHGKEDIADLIKLYNSGATEENQISYTDYVALVMSGVSTIIDAISYILIGFVSVSLVVSSIMIGIITYISVLERTKEIGILRAVGASKRDVSRVFTAETIIEGFAAGAIGIAVTIVLCIILNAILYSLSGLPGLKAILPPKAGVVLVLISILLTLVAGFFPSRLAAKKDPVEALRTE